MIYMCKVIHYYWQMYSKASAESAERLRAWFCMLLVGTRIIMSGMPEKDRSRITITDWCWYAINGRERHHRWNVSCHTLTRKSQQQVHERLWSKRKIFISHVVGCQQLVWMGDVTEIACGWFRMEKRLV